MGDLDEYDEEGCEPSWFFQGYDPLSRARCSGLQCPLEPQPDAFNTALYCILYFSSYQSLLCQALCSTKEILPSTRPVQVSDT